MTPSSSAPSGPRRTQTSTTKYWRKDHELNFLPTGAYTDTGFHLGPWRRLENQIRKRGNATVITGAIYNNCGNEKIEAPCVVYKVARFEDGEILAVFLPNHP